MLKVCIRLHHTPTPLLEERGIFSLWAGYPGWRSLVADPGLSLSCPFGAAPVGEADWKAEVRRMESVSRSHGVNRPSGTGVGRDRKGRTSNIERRTSNGELGRAQMWGEV